MFTRSTQRAADKATKKAKKRHDAAERAREKGLTQTFNTATQLIEELTALQKANPKFDFDFEKKNDGVLIVTNIPIKSGDYKGQDMQINVTNKGLTISLTTDRGGFWQDYNSSVTTPWVKSAAKVVAKHIGKRGLAS